jgi:hypothetical protein
MKRQIRLSLATAAVLCSSVLVMTQRVQARFEVEERARFRATDSSSKTNTN